jgi:hypothetical protein
VPLEGQTQELTAVAETRPLPDSAGSERLHPNTNAKSESRHKHNREIVLMDDRLQMLSRDEQA